MAKNIEPKLRKIGDYLKLEEDTVFVIPEYQRAYSWGKDHCDKLWQDICDFVDSDSKDRYFFGTIIINCQDDDKKLGLIDGQQRTTTFLLLLKALLIRINNAIKQTEIDEDSESLCRGLKERRRRIMGILYRAETEDIPDMPDKVLDAKICISKAILENKSINELYKDDLKTILSSVDYDEAKEKVQQIKHKQKENRFTNYFRNFKFFYYDKISELSDSRLNKIAKTLTDSCEVIEIKSWQVEQAITMFNSLNSDGLPLYDADIISAKLYAVAEKAGQSKEFRDYWKELLDRIEELKKLEIANIDSILMQYMYYVRALKKEIISESGSTNVTTPGLRRYFTEINKEILNNPLELCKGLINLVKIWVKIYDYPIVQVLLKFNENTKLFLGSYFYRFNVDVVTEEIIHIVVESMLRLFSILEIVDTGYSSRYFKTFLFKENVKLVNSNKEEEIATDFGNHINSNWYKDVIKKAILEYERNALVYLNEYLFAKESDKSFKLGSKYDIEHIMPNSGHNLQVIRNDAGIDSEDEFKIYVNKLGNKILLEEKINRSISNEWFRTKVSTKLEAKTGYIDSIYPIAQSLVSKYKNNSKPYWEKIDINNATESAADRIVRFIFDK